MCLDRPPPSIRSSEYWIENREDIEVRPIFCSYELIGLVLRSPNELDLLLRLPPAELTTSNSRTLVCIFSLSGSVQRHLNFFSRRSKIAAIRCSDWDMITCADTLELGPTMVTSRSVGLRSVLP